MRGKVSHLGGPSILSGAALSCVPATPQWRVVVLASSLCLHTEKSHFTFPALMTEMEYAWIVSSSKRARKERNVVLGCHSCACSCPLKNGAELSAQLQLYRISVPRQLSNKWHVLHPPQFGHFHQPKIAHRASFFYRRLHFWRRLFLGLIRYCIRMIAMGFLLGGRRKRETKGEKWRIQYRTEKWRGWWRDSKRESETERERVSKTEEKICE